MTRLVFIIVLSVCCDIAAAAVSQQETYWQQVLESASADKIVWLNHDGEKTLALLAGDHTGHPRGAAILLHSAGMHPDWPEVIAPLRQALPDYGWITLSVQMPVLPRSADLAEYAPLLADVPARLDSAIAWLQSQGIHNIVLIGHGFGNIMAAHYLAAHVNTPVRAFIGIGMADYSSVDKQFDLNQLLTDITMPVLDIYGSRDSDPVVKFVRTRARAVQQASLSASRNRQLSAFAGSASGRSAATKTYGFISYRRFEINGADRDFSGFESVLIKRIAGWLKHHAGGISRQARK